MEVSAMEMAKDVRVAIDMNKGDDPLILEGDTDTLTLDEIILSKLPDAVRIVELEAPHVMLEGGRDFMGCAEAYPLNKNSNSLDKNSDPADKNSGQGISWGENGKGSIFLPDDFLRLVSFRMSDWERTVYEAISEHDARYALQSSRWGGIRGNPEKPVVAIVRGSGGKVLEFYSCRDATATIAEAHYLPIPKIDSEGKISVSEECYRPAVYRAASLALASVGDQLSTVMLELSRSLLH